MKVTCNALNYRLLFVISLKGFSAKYKKKIINESSWLYKSLYKTWQHQNLLYAWTIFAPPLVNYPEFSFKIRRWNIALIMSTLFGVKMNLFTEDTSIKRSMLLFAIDADCRIITHKSQCGRSYYQKCSISHSSETSKFASLLKQDDI